MALNCGHESSEKVMAALLARPSLLNHALYDAVQTPSCLRLAHHSHKSSTQGRNQQEISP
jgi:hypothetical protein